MLTRIPVHRELASALHSLICNHDIMILSAVKSQQIFFSSYPRFIRLCCPFTFDSNFLWRIRQQCIHLLIHSISVHQGGFVLWPAARHHHYIERDGLNSYSYVPCDKRHATLEKVFVKRCVAVTFFCNRGFFICCFQTETIDNFRDLELAATQLSVSIGRM